MDSPLSRPDIPLSLQQESARLCGEHGLQRKAEGHAQD